jgi:hypothetical protein
VHGQLGGHGFINAGEELPELRPTVAAVQFADDGAVGDGERREQAGGTGAGVGPVSKWGGLRACS